MAMCVWLYMYGYVCMDMHAWLCMFGYICMAMSVWLCIAMYGYLCLAMYARLCMWRSGEVVNRVNPYNKRVISSNLARVTIKTTLMRKAMENHLIKSNSLEKSQSPLSDYCYVSGCYVRLSMRRSFLYMYD